MIEVASELLGGKLPVARDDPLLDTPDHFGSRIRAIQHVVEIGRRVAHPFMQRRRRRVPVGEHKPLVGFDPGLTRAPFGLVQDFAEGPLLERHADEISGDIVRPAMVAARKVLGVAVILAAQLHAAMPALVQEDLDRSVLLANHDDRVLAHVGRQEIAGLSHMRFMAKKQPGTSEDHLLFHVVDILISIDSRIYEAIFFVEQALDRRTAPNIRRRLTIWVAATHFTLPIAKHKIQSDLTHRENSHRKRNTKLPQGIVTMFYLFLYFDAYQ